MPKALLPVAGEPIVFRQLHLLQRYGVKRVVVLAGHLADALREKIEPAAARLGLELHVLVESEPLGTCGGLHAARGLLGKEHFLFFCGDIAVEMDLERLIEVHMESAAAATVSIAFSKVSPLPAAVVAMRRLRSAGPMNSPSMPAIEAISSALATACGVSTWVSTKVSWLASVL